MQPAPLSREIAAGRRVGDDRWRQTRNRTARDLHVGIGIGVEPVADTQCIVSRALIDIELPFDVIERGSIVEDLVPHRVG